jgi:ribosomal protein S18 acetylase RimI-like enzyme
MITLRPVVADDEEFLFELYAGTRAGELALGRWDAAQAATFLQLQFRAQQQSYHHQFPAATSQIVLAGGAAVGRLITDRSAAEVLLVDISLLTAWQGRGIGTSLIRGLQAEAAASGRPIQLHVLATNRAQRLYQRLDFVTQGDPAVYLTMTWQPPAADAENLASMRHLP